VGREVITNPVQLRRLAKRAQRLAGGVQDQKIRDKMKAAAAEYEQRVKEVELDDATGQ
jgi:hypothetical protein